MRESFPTDLLMRFLQATPEQQAAIARFLRGATSSIPTPNSHSSPCSPHSALCTHHFALRKGLGMWHLVFEGQGADLRHERGIFYVAYLLSNPPAQPIHALDLMAKIPELYRRQLGLPQLPAPTTGKMSTLESSARLQERNLALDDTQSIRALFKKQKELEAILDDDSECEPVKAEALRELEAIYEFQKKHARRSRDSAQNAADAVRLAIQRFQRRLYDATDTSGRPNPVLRGFAEHIEKYILIPSARYSRHGRSEARAGLAGCFTYEPPEGVRWER